MSNGARFDSLLVRHLAEELDRLLRGRSVRLRGLSGAAHGVRLDLGAGESLHLDLHPATRGVRRDPDGGAAASGHRLRVERVHAPADERVLRFELLGGNRFREESRTLVVELIPTRENAYELDGEGRVLQLLRSLHDPARRLLPGSVYSPPPPTDRYLPEAPDADRSARRVWSERLAPLEASERRAAFLSGFAYAGPLNAAWVLGCAATPDAPARALDGAFSRWWDLVHGPARPHLLATPGGMQPYPHPLAGESAHPLDSLLEGFARAAAFRASSDAAPAPAPELVERAEKRLAAAHRRHQRLLDEKERAGSSDALRRSADLLLAHLHRVERGAERAVLPGWEGGEVEIALDPERTPAENADLLYAEARRRDRAQARLPSLIQAAEEEIERRERELAAARDGRGAAEPEPRAARRGGDASGQVDEGLPYRSYRTSGGLEVRVGRSARANDRLTFGHSDPRDVWMHARSVGGSHVILRWPRDEAPPARDLEEAAVLAALHSKARGSGVVAVDWTQRRHVRKPRGAPPGAVTPGRTRTLFVEPDAAVEERMRRGAE